MPKVAPDIIYSDERLCPIIDSHNSVYQLPLYKNEDYFINLESYNAFVRATERLIRTNDRYKKYINHLKTKVGLNFCQVFPEITDDEADIEMHHGPILTLYDYVTITIEYFLYKKWKITTMSIANQVLSDHEDDIIQITMLSTSGHEQVTDRSIFLNYKQGYGDLSGYIRKYGKVLNDDMIKKINSYIDRSLMYDSNDFDIFKLNDALLKYKVD